MSIIITNVVLGIVSLILLGIIINDAICLYREMR